MSRSSYSSIACDSQRSNRLAIAIFVIIVSLLIEGCATYTFKDKQYETQNEPNREVVWSYFWSIPKVPTVSIDSCYCQGRPVGEVTVRRNALQSLITFATLGIASPASIEWRCALPVPVVDSLRDPVPLYCDTMIVDTVMAITCYGLDCDTMIVNNDLQISCDTVEVINNGENQID